MVWPDWLTARRVLAIALVQVAVLGLVGGAVFANYGGFGGTADTERGNFEVHNHEDDPVNVTVVVLDVRTDTRLLEATVALGTDGIEGYYSFSWPPMAPGPKRLVVVAGAHRNSYEFTVGEDGRGPNLVGSLASDGIEFTLRTTGM